MKDLIYLQSLLVSFIYIVLNKIFSFIFSSTITKVFYS